MTKVLFVSNDPSIFVEDSPARARMYVYAAKIGELHIVSPAPRRARESHEGALHLHPVHVPRLLRVFALRMRAHRIIRKYGIEVVSAQDPFELGLAALNARRGTTAVLHVQVHTDFLSPWFTRSGSWRMNLLNRLRVKLAGYVLRRAKRIRVVSERIKKGMVERYGRNLREPTVIPIAVDAQVPAPVRLPAHACKFALLCVSRLEPEKRIEDILQALVLVKRDYASIGLFVAGSGRAKRALAKRAQALGLSGSVVFLGNRPDARALMGSAQAFVQASAYEGYGRTLIEAALAGVPIITTDTGIVGEVLHAQREVLVAPVDAPQELAKHIERLIADNRARLALTLAAKQAVAAHLRAQGDLTARIADDLNACLGL